MQNHKCLTVCRGIGCSIHTILYKAQRVGGMEGKLGNSAQFYCAATWQVNQAPHGSF